MTSNLQETRTETEIVPKQRRGLLSRIRRRRALKLDQANNRGQTPPPKPSSEPQEHDTPATDNSEEGDFVNQHTNDHAETSCIVLTEKEGLKQVRFPAKDALKSVPIYTRRDLETPPPAREAAFGGPPRYDWIDIETAAAIKVQSVARRNMTLRQLERQGISSAALRNRQRRREARQTGGVTGSTDIPNLFACCGIGLAFGESTEEHAAATRQFEREQYLERKHQQEKREEELRRGFPKLATQRRQNDENVQEFYEIVEESEVENDKGYIENTY